MKSHFMMRVTAKKSGAIATSCTSVMVRIYYLQLPQLIRIADRDAGFECTSNLIVAAN